jgi:indolepyruvate ferredoxin oxidoreductase alpha subunit
MAERSFAAEVEHLRIGAGETFRGEGILAITKALLENGVGYVGGYQGAPISHLMDVLADAQDILGELGVHFEANASEAAAAAMLAASVHYPIRGAVTFKSTVGTNVASDALANLASGGVTGGALIIVGEDYGEGSSIMQERSHAFATKSQIWLLDPRPNLPSIVAAVRHGFELSEASNTPVMLEVRIRGCHVHGEFLASDNKAPDFTVADALQNPRRKTDRVVLPPASFQHEQEKVTKRWPAAVEYIKKNKLNEFFGPSDGPCGLILQGGLYNATIRALQRLGLANLYGDTDIPLYVLNVTYPLIDSELIEFCENKSAVLMIEEGQPGYLEESVAAMLYKAGGQTQLCGKDILPLAGELTGKVMYESLGTFFERHLPQNKKPPAVPISIVADMPDLSKTVPMRPPGFCTGCPERPIFAATKLVQNEIGEHHISSDIGCHLFSIMPPFDIGGTTMGYGLGPASAAGLKADGARRSISFIGDGGFWHNGLTSSIGNAVFNEQDGVIVIVDNHYSAATGGQDILSSRANNKSRSTRHPIAEAVRGMGVKWVRQLDHTYDIAAMKKVLTEALTTAEKGPKVIVAASECMLNRQRRERPLAAKKLAAGEPVSKPRFGVDEDICTGDHACMRLSGCPSLTLKKLDDPLRDDPVAHIDETCVGCGNCGEVADAAVLCPSFFRTDALHNASALRQKIAQWRGGLIGWLQDRRARGRLQFADSADG